mmetsp:Transcript_20891/g.30069  ORF Transcript_20891/g.30069 Transcript_20891/m.30069 type:complete len:596 (+) Transcript_20891:72-1859(+)
MKKATERDKLLGPSSGGLTKNQHYMSASAFLTVAEEINRQRQTTAHLSRSASIGIDMTPSALNPIREGQRRALYGTLPFVSAFGMTKRENEIRKVLSSVSHKSLTDLAKESEHAEMLEEVDVDEIIVTFPLVMAVLVAIISQFLVGYNTAVMNSPEGVVFPGHSTAEWSFAVSAFAIGGPLGAIAGGLLANKRGRRGAMLVNSWIFLFGGLILTLAPSILWIIPARLIIGFASGLSSVVVPVYLGEIAPPTLRGTLGTCTQFAMVTGILVSALMAFPLATATLWRWLFAVTPILAGSQLLVSPFLLESPRWLLNHDENSSVARVVIKALRGFRSDEEIENEVQNFMYASSKHKTSRSSAHSSGAMWDLLHAKDVRILVVSVIVLQMAQQLCGINAVFYYSSMFFDGVLSNPLQGTALVSFINVVATYAALKLMDDTNRRTLLLWSAGGMLISTIFIIAALLHVVPNIVALVAVMAFVSFFEIGLGPIPWLIVAEMFDAKYVATAMSMACIVNWACNFLVGLLFPFMQQSLGAYSFGPFGVVLVATYFFTYLQLPETHGRSVEEIQRLVGSGDEEVRRAIEVIEGIDDYDFGDDAL